MNPLTFHHPPEHQFVSVSRELREIEHTCELCGHIEVQTLGIVPNNQPLEVYLER